MRSMYLAWCLLVSVLATTPAWAALVSVDPHEQQGVVFASDEATGGGSSEEEEEPDCD